MVASAEQGFSAPAAGCFKIGAESCLFDLFVLFVVGNRFDFIEFSI